MPSKPDANFIWSIANLLRGPYKPKEYGDVVLPMTILRRLDCVLAATKDAVLSEQKRSGDRTAKDLSTSSCARQRSTRSTTPRRTCSRR